MLAMSALSLQALSGGRFILGLGTSGPQVMEGWHGVRFDRPVRRTRETIEIIRAITAGERLELRRRDLHAAASGRRGPQHPLADRRRPHVPIYVAALGPANLRMTGELADGWIGNSFFPETADVFFDPIRAGRAAAGRAAARLRSSRSSVGVEFTDDVEEAGRRHAEGYAFTFGAMGSPTRNFYNDAFARQGYGDDVARSATALARPAIATRPRKRVPTAIGLGTNLIGTDDLVRERLRLYRAAGITTLRVGLSGGPGGDGDRHPTRPSRPAPRPRPGREPRTPDLTLSTPPRPLAAPSPPSPNPTQTDTDLYLFEWDFVLDVPPSPLPGKPLIMTTMSRQSGHSVG